MKSILGHLGFAGVRVFVGLAMAFAHGLGKIPPSEGLITGIAAQGFPLAIVFAWMVGLIEFLGGIFIALGLFTRVMGLLWALVMSGAAFVIHATDPFNIQERAFLYLAFGILYLCHGGGRYALDNLINKPKN
jgi:putative oxidoreductase